MTNHEKQVHAWNGTRLSVPLARGRDVNKVNHNPRANAKCMQGGVTCEPRHAVGFRGLGSMLCAAEGHRIDAGFRTPDMAKSISSQTSFPMCQLLYDGSGKEIRWPVKEILRISITCM